MLKRKNLIEAIKEFRVDLQTDFGANIYFEEQLIKGFIKRDIYNVKNRFRVMIVMNVELGFFYGGEDEAPEGEYRKNIPVICTLWETEYLKMDDVEILKKIMDSVLWEFVHVLMEFNRLEEKVRKLDRQLHPNPNPFDLDELEEAEIDPFENDFGIDLNDIKKRMICNERNIRNN